MKIIKIKLKIRVYGRKKRTFPFVQSARRGRKKQLFVFKEAVDFGKKLVAINAVNSASHFNGFAAGSGATEAVHTDFKEEGRGFGSDVKDIADDRFSGNFHDSNQPFVFFIESGSQMTSVSFLKLLAESFRNNIILS